MMSVRLALPVAALAAALSATVALADDDSARKFLTEEFSKADAANSPANENTQVANVSAIEQPQQKNNTANPWAGVTAPAMPAVTETQNAAILALIEKHAAANGLPAGFARAVVQIESNFNPRATGSQREVGLMQIKFETAKGIGFTGTREELYNPDTNLQWGMKYLGMSWKLGGNTPCGAVMKYQGGHAVTQMSAASRVYCAKVQAHMASK